MLFTGERITSASARHILGEEASRALRLLRVRDRAVTRALAEADEGLMRGAAGRIVWRAGSYRAPGKYPQAPTTVGGIMTAFAPRSASPMRVSSVASSTCSAVAIP